MIPPRAGSILLLCAALIFLPLSSHARTAKSLTKKGGPSAAKESTPSPKERSVAVMTDVKHWSNPDYTRIAISLDHETSYEHHQLKGDPREGKPSRLYLDIHGCRLSGKFSQIPIGDGLLRQVRVAQHTPDTVRVVIDLESIKDFKIFSFSNPYRIIVDFRGELREEMKSLPPPALKQTPFPTLSPAELTAESTSKPPSDEPVLTEDSPRKGNPKHRQHTTPPPIRRIVIDPGHGGHDPGAIGKNGTREKDVVLEIGRELARILSQEYSLDVVMTRSSDVFIELQERTAIANKVGADLFVSIHANAAPNRGASGVETYYLNLAKTEKVAQLAALENGTSLEKVSLLQAVLFDLMAHYKLNDSAHLAEDVQKALVKRLSRSYSSLRNLGVKQGPFYVLVGATMPSILVETAFISNPAEEERLSDPAYRKATAAGIADGIAAYMSALYRGGR
ncbi:MAG: N-acetylmuramoyl-L-alanine amidase [Desulfuromonadia bacterium]